MKKLIPALALVCGFYMQTQAQIKQAPSQTLIEIKPDLENPEGCVLTLSDVSYNIDENTFSMLFNLAGMQNADDVKAYFGEEVNGQTILLFKNSEVLSQALSNEVNDQPLRLDAIMIINGQNVPALFEVIQKRDEKKQLYNELSVSIPFQNMLIPKIGEIRMFIKTKA